jgi:cation transport regulator ChaC
MSFDTIQENKKRQSLDDFDEIWLFGYGSLIYKVDFPILAKKTAAIKGWKRRFWQGSHDHRGTPENPGRVATLIAETDETCFGMAYQVSKDAFEHLDHREKNGYLRYEVEIQLFAEDSSTQMKAGLVYIAPTDNDAYLGHASEKEIAQHIQRSAGPSGANRDYLLELADALRAMNVEDAHVFAIEQHLKTY